MTATRAFSDLITIGRVVKPQGRKGEVVVEPFSDRPGRFSELRRVFLPATGDSFAEWQVEGHWPHKHREVLKLAGVDSIDDAERLRGMDVRIPEEDLDVLPQGSYYHYQLRGLRVEDGHGHVGFSVECLVGGVWISVWNGGGIGCAQPVHSLGAACGLSCRPGA